MHTTKRTPLGETQKGKTVYIDPKTRTTHMHIIGASGEGKSKFMEHLIRQDIINDNGLCFIDPHGYLYHDIVRWCETKRMLDPDRPKPKKIILFDPSAEGWTFGFNPLQTNTPDISFHVDAMVKAVAKVWGGEDSDKTPLLKRCLRVLFHALAEKNLTLYEAQHLIDPDNELIREYLTRDLNDYTIRKQWERFNAMSANRFEDHFSSTTNRMMEFLSSPLIRTVVGQVEHTINFRKIMDEGYILLVNLASTDKISEDNARLLGTLIVNDLFMKAKGRPQNSRSFYLYIDECSLFINEDIRRILDEGRKFGLHLILANQHLAQLKKAGEDVYHAVMTDAKTKVIFGGLNVEDAQVLAEHVFLGELDLEESKKSLEKPVVVGHETVQLHSRVHATTYSEAEGRGSSSGAGTVHGDSEAEVLVPGGILGDEQVAVNIGKTSAESEHEAESESSSSSFSESVSEAIHEALKPILKKLPGGHFDLKEQLYKKMALMVNQPQQHAIIKLPKKVSKVVKTPFVEEGYARKERVKRFKDQCYNLADYASPRKIIEQQIAERQRLIVEKAKKMKEPVEPKSFREEREAPPRVKTSKSFRERG